MIPSWLQHLHGTPYGYWYYGCQCYRCYARQARDCGNAVMTEDEFDAQDRLQEEIEAMTPEARAEFYRLESLEMMCVNGVEHEIQ